MMRLKLLAGVGLLALCGPLYAEPDPQPQNGSPAATPRNSDSVDDLIKQQNLEAARAEQKRQATLAGRDDFRKSLDEDVTKRRLTQAQADEIYNDVLVDGSAVLNRVGGRSAALAKGVIGSFKIASDKVGNEFTPDMNDPNFSQGMAESVVDLASVGIVLNQELIREVGPDLGKLLNVFADASQKRVDFIKANGTAPALYIQNTQSETTRFKRVIAALPSRLDVVDYKLTKAQTDLDVNREKHIEKIKPMIEAKREELTKKYGPDVKKWPKEELPPPPPPLPTGPKMNDDGTYGTKLPWEMPSTAPSPVSSPSSKPTRTGSSEGTVPGTGRPTAIGPGTAPGSDPFQGLRVSPQAGGTATTTSQTPTSGQSSQTTAAPKPAQGSASKAANAATNPASNIPKAPPKSSPKPPPVDPAKIARTNLPEQTAPIGPVDKKSTDLGMGPGTPRPAPNGTNIKPSTNPNAKPSQKPGTGAPGTAMAAASGASNNGANAGKPPVTPSKTTRVPADKPTPSATNAGKAAGVAAAGTQSVIALTGEAYESGKKAGSVNPTPLRRKTPSAADIGKGAAALAESSVQDAAKPKKPTIQGFGKDVRVDPDALFAAAMANQGKKPVPLSRDMERMIKGLPPIKSSTDTASKTTPSGGLQGFVGSLSAQLEALLKPKPTGSAGASAAASTGKAADAIAQRVPAKIAQQKAPAPFVQPRQPGGPDYPLAPKRTTAQQQAGAAQGQWRPGDSFGAAGAAAAAAASATPPDAVDAARQRIDDRFDAARARWDAVAATVEYDENGVPHRTRTNPAPVNTYRRPAPTPRAVDESTFGRFERGLGSLSVLDLEPIYAGWNVNTAPFGSAGAATPTSAGSVGPSSAGNSLRLDWYLPPSGYLSTELAAQRAIGALNGIGAWMGVPTNWGGLDLASGPIRVTGNARPQFGSREDMLRLTSFGGGFNPSNPFGDVTPSQYQPLADSARDLARLLYGPLWSDTPYRLQFDPSGMYGRESGGALVASLFGSNADYLRQLKSNGLGGLGQLLAQPFNVVLTWGAGAFDLDLHMTGPSGVGSTDRFHIYYAARGSQTVFPFAELIKDCICNSGSEVILTSQLVKGGVYRISTFNFGDQSATSSNLSTMAGAQLQIVRGGVAVSQGNGTTIVGGRVIYTGAPPTTGAGNTWVAVEINAANGRITAPNTIIQSGSSDGVR